MLRHSFSLSGREIEKLLKKGFKFKNYALLSKNSTFIKLSVANIEMSHFLTLNKDNLFTAEIQKESAIFSALTQKIVSECESILVEYCLTTHRCQLVFVAKESFSQDFSTFNHYQLIYAQDKRDYTSDCFIIQLSKKELLSLK